MAAFLVQKKRDCLKEQSAEILLGVSLFPKALLSVDSMNIERDNLIRSNPMINKSKVRGVLITFVKNL